MNENKNDEPKLGSRNLSPRARKAPYIRPAKSAQISRIEPLKTTEDLMAILRIGKTKAYDLSKNGEIPRVQIGGCVRFKVSDIQAYIDRNSTGRKQGGGS